MMEGQLAYVLEHAQMLLAEHSSSSTSPPFRSTTLPAVYSYVSMQSEVRTLEFWRSIIAECLAAFFYVLVVLSVSTSSTEHLLQINCALASGLIVAVLMASVGRTCHINPIVTMALLVARQLSPLRAILYVCAQCGGGVAGAALVLGVHGRINDPVLRASYPSFGMELVLAFLIAYAVCAAHNERRGGGGGGGRGGGKGSSHVVLSPVVARPWHNLDALIVGAAHSAGLVAWKGSLNPARALGSAFVSKNDDRFEKHWVFWAGPMLGAVAGALAFEFVFNGRNKRNDKFDTAFGAHNTYGRVAAKAAPGLPTAAAGLAGPGLPGAGGLPAGGMPGTGLVSGPGYGVGGGFLESGSEEDMLDDLERAKQYKSNIMHEMGDAGHYGRYTNRGGRYDIYSGSKSLYGGDARSAVMYDSRSMYEATPGQLRRSRSNHTKPGGPLSSRVGTANMGGSRRNPYDFLPEEPKEHVVMAPKAGGVGRFNDAANSPGVVDFDYGPSRGMSGNKEYGNEYGSKRTNYYNDEPVYSGRNSNFNYGNFQTPNGPNTNVVASNAIATTAANPVVSSNVGSNAYNAATVRNTNDNF